MGSDWGIHVTSKYFSSQRDVPFDGSAFIYAHRYLSRLKNLC